MRKKCVMASLILAGLTAALAVAAAEGQKSSPAAVEGSKAAGDAAWKEFESSAKPPNPPKDWATKEPTPEEREKFREEVGQAALNAAARARDFYTTYPNHEKAGDAKRREKKLLETAATYGISGSVEKLEENPLLSEDEKFALKLNKVHSDALKQQGKGFPAVMAEFEKGVRGMIKEFPERPEGYVELLKVAKNSDTEKAKGIYAELIESKADDRLKEHAKQQLKVLGYIGQPFELSVTGVDGKPIDMKDYLGKVVLIDYWATWCGPCIVALPGVKAAYEKYHEKGFDIIGINLDKQKGVFQNFVKEQEMTWPQYYDGQGWGNAVAREYGVMVLPTMWLVDKKGILREMNAREDLDEKIEKYLAEKD